MRVVFWDQVVSAWLSESLQLELPKRTVQAVISMDDTRLLLIHRKGNAFAFSTCFFNIRKAFPASLIATLHPWKTDLRRKNYLRINPWFGAKLSKRNKWAEIADLLIEYKLA